MSEKERRLYWKQRREAIAKKEARRQAAQALGMGVYEYCRFVKQHKQSNLIVSEIVGGNRNTQEVAV